MEKYFDVAISLFVCGFGIYIVLTGRLPIGSADDAEDGPTMWLYGRRARLVGYVIVFVGAVFLAGAAGLVHLNARWV